MHSLFIPALVLSLVATSALGQTDSFPLADPASHIKPVATTLSLGHLTHSIEPVADASEMKYENGYFVGLTSNGSVQVLDKEGRATASFLPRPQLEQPPREFQLLSTNDVTVALDGSITVSIIYMLPKDARRYFYLLKFDKTGNFVEQLDLGSWRAMRICSAQDGSVWTLSGEERLGFAVYSPDEGVLRNYKTSSGLQKAVAPRSRFPEDNRNSFAQNAAIDCSGEGVHALTSDGQWLDYARDGKLTITQVDSAGPLRADGPPRLRGFAYLPTGHAYVVVDFGSHDSSLRRLFELLPSANGLTLHWSEVLPAQRKNQSLFSSDEKASNEGHVVTHLLGADHSDGDQLVYILSGASTIHWSRPTLSSVLATAE
jgi:hypothetical protein